MIEELADKSTEERLTPENATPAWCVLLALSLFLIPEHRKL